MKFEQHWPRGFRGEKYLKLSTFSLYKCMGLYKCIQKQTWPRRIKVKCQCTTIILAHLVDLLSLMGSMQRFSHKASLVLEKQIFKGFYHIWACQPSWSMDGTYFSILSFPCPREAPNKIWATLAQRLQRRIRLKFSTFFPYTCIGKQTTSP